MLAERQHRHGARTREAHRGHAGCRRGGVRAQKFPLAASCRISLSSVGSETALRSRAFSVSRSFSPLHLVRLQTTVLLTPAVVRDLGDANQPDRLCNRRPLRRQHLAMISSGLCPFLPSFPKSRTTSMGRFTMKSHSHSRRRVRRQEYEKEGDLGRVFR